MPEFFIGPDGGIWLRRPTGSGTFDRPKLDSDESEFATAWDHYRAALNAAAAAAALAETNAAELEQAAGVAAAEESP